MDLYIEEARQFYKTVFKPLAKQCENTFGTKVRRYGNLLRKIDYYMTWNDGLDEAQACIDQHMAFVCSFLRLDADAQTIEFIKQQTDHVQLIHSSIQEFRLLLHYMLLRYWYRLFQWKQNLLKKKEIFHASVQKKASISEKKCRKRSVVKNAHG